MEKVKQEIERMERMGVIIREEELTDWCAGVVVVPKKGKSACICVDLIKFNERAHRQNYIPPSVDQT